MSTAAGMIPNEVCNFIARQLSPTNPETLRANLETRGLESLNVDQLKRVAKLMRNFRFIQNERYRGLSNLRKAELIQWIRRPFYLDYPACNLLNEAALQELQGSSSSSAAAAVATTQSTSTPAARQHAFNTACSSSRAAAAAVPQHVFVQQHAGFRTPPFHPMMICGFYPGSAHSPFAAMPMNAGTPLIQLPSGYTMPSSNNRNSSSNKAAAAASLQKKSTSASQPSNSVRVKRERSNTVNESSASSASIAASTPIPSPHATPILNNNSFSNNNTTNASNTADTDNGADEESSVPQNILETTLMSSLMNMGFTDRSEILSSIRRLRNDPEYVTSATNLTSDVVMLDIISQREEAEEARKMDEARLLSEQSRKEEARLLRQRNAELLTEQQREASWKEWLEKDDMFPHSWLLQLSNVQKAVEPIWRDGGNIQIKHKFVELIKLEKNARKWYKNDLPRSYFVNVLAAKLVACKDSSAVVWKQTLDAELKRLEHQMYTLSEQKGGVPRMFLDAHDAAITAATANDKTNRDGDDDDDIVVLVTSPASIGTKTTAAKENTFPGRSSTSPRKRHKPETPRRSEDNTGTNDVDVIEIL